MWRCATGTDDAAARIRYELSRRPHQERSRHCARHRDHAGPAARGRRGRGRRYQPYRDAHRRQLPRIARTAVCGRGGRGSSRPRPGRRARLERRPHRRLRLLVHRWRVDRVSHAARRRECRPLLRCRLDDRRCAIACIRRAQLGTRHAAVAALWMGPGRLVAAAWTARDSRVRGDLGGGRSRRW